MRYRLFLLVFALGLPTHFVRAADVDKEKLIPLRRFYAKDRNEHVYTHDEGEIAAWRKNPKMDEHGITGLVSPVELPDTIRIWRAVRPSDGKHYHYSKAPGAANKITVEDKVFHAYAWKKSGDGRVAIYGSTWLDGTDTFFDSRDNMKKMSKNSKNALGVVRPEQGLVFYVYPSTEKPPEDEDKIEPEPKAVSPEEKAATDKKAQDDKLAADEKQAESKMRAAEALFSSGKADSYKKALREIIDKYPNTKAAAAAKEKLK